MVRSSTLKANLSPYMQGFLTSEAVRHDTIELKRIYIDINDGNMFDGIMFSQLMYWSSPDKNGKSRLTVIRDNEFWLVKEYADWWDECRIDERTARDCVNRMVQRGLVVKKVAVWNGTRAVHLRVDFEVFQRLTQEMLSIEDAAQRKEAIKSKRREMSFAVKRRLQTTGNVISYNESETTTETTLENQFARALSGGAARVDSSNEQQPIPEAVADAVPPSKEATPAQPEPDAQPDHVATGEQTPSKVPPKVSPPCRECNGTGIVNSGYIFGEYFEDKCLDCEGTGIEPNRQYFTDEMRKQYTVVQRDLRADGRATNHLVPHGKKATLCKHRHYSEPVSTDTIDCLVCANEAKQQQIAPPRTLTPGYYYVLNGVAVGPYKSHSTATTHAPSGALVCAAANVPTDATVQAPEPPAKKSKATKPAAYSSKPVFDALAAVLFDATDPADVNAVGGRVGKVRTRLIDHILAKRKETDLTEATITELVAHIRKFKDWYTAEFPRISLPRDPEKFMAAWLQYVKSGGVASAKTENGVDLNDYIEVEVMTEWGAWSERRILKSELHKYQIKGAA